MVFGVLCACPGLVSVHAINEERVLEFHLLVLFIITFVPAVAMPGPNAAFAVAQSLTHGGKTAIMAPVGFAAATAIHVTLILSGVGLIISRYSQAFILLKWVGVIYLFWMAYKAYKSSPESLLVTQKKIAPLKIFNYALLVSLTNPKAILVGTLVFPIYINENQPFLPQAVALGVTAMLISFFVYTSYVLCAERLSEKLKRSSFANKILGSIYAGAGTALVSINR